MAHLFTFVMDYLGGTYVAQAEADNPAEAMPIWLRDLKIEEIECFDREDQGKIIAKGFLDEEPVLISGLINVWCFTLQTKRGMGLVNIVKTDS